MKLREFDVNKLIAKNIRTYIPTAEKRQLIDMGINIATLMTGEDSRIFRNEVAKGNIYAPLVVDGLSKELFLDAVLYNNYLGLTPDSFTAEDFDYVRSRDYYGKLQKYMRDSKDKHMKEVLHKMFADYKLLREMFDMYLDNTVKAFNYKTNIARDVAIVKAAVAAALEEHKNGETPDIAKYIDETINGTETEKPNEDTASADTGGMKNTGAES